MLKKSWCTGEDSNLRSSKERQVYSLLPLTARPPVRFFLGLRNGFQPASPSPPFDSRRPSAHPPLYQKGSATLRCCALAAGRLASPVGSPALFCAYRRVGKTRP